MSFNSFSFLGCFLPLMLILYYILPQRARNGALLLGSLLFYGFGTRDRLWNFGLLIALILLTYALGLLLEGLTTRDGQRSRNEPPDPVPQRNLEIFTVQNPNRQESQDIPTARNPNRQESRKIPPARNRNRRESRDIPTARNRKRNLDRSPRLLLALALVLLFGLLAAFKWAGLLGSDLALPLGMSFFTFQMAGYLIDIYQGAPAEDRLLRYAGEILLFPKLLSGPLTPYGALRPQMEQRSCSIEGFDMGLRIFIRGLAMKVLLADQLSGLWRQVKALGFESISTALAWMGIIAYSLQIYFDFCGYSKMALGLGQMLGFRLPRNFDHPYAACTMTEFWRKWHMSLGAWFRDYVYIPLGGNRRGKARTALNLLIVWLLTGLWHGGSLNFLAWGLFLFLLILGEKFLWGKALERRPVLGHLYMALTIPLSWLLFALSDGKKILAYLGRLFPLTGQLGGLRPWDFLPYARRYGILLAAGIFLAMPWADRFWKKYNRSPLDTLLCLLLFWAAVYCLGATSGDPFLYFTF